MNLPLRSILSLGLAVAASLSVASPAPAADPATAPARRPNVIILLADDQGWAGVGYHDGFVKTPNIDRIARQGVELDRFYASPMCSPTREGIMTGRYPMRFGMGRSVVRPWAKWGLPPEERTLPETLADAGYAHRGAFGKWHMGHLDPKWHPLAQGFTDYKGCYNGAAAYFTRDRDGEVDWHRNWDDIDEDGYTTDLIVDASVAYVKQHAKDGPFLCYTAFTSPHEPLEAPKEYIERYAHLDDDPSDGKPSAKQVTAAMIASMDDGIGRILKAIDDAGIADNTLVWFMSDNGGPNGFPGNNAPLRGGKMHVYEGGVRVPAAVWWPGVIEGGRKLSVPMVNVDILPTVARAAGAPVAAPAGPLDGVDLLDVLAGKQDKLADRDLYYFVGQAGLDNEELAVTTADGWKLIIVGPDVRRPEGFSSPKHRVELFHLSEDLVEKTDLAAKEPERVKKMGQKLVDFRKSEPEHSLPPLNRKPPRFQPPPHWNNGPATRPVAAQAQ